MKRKQSNSEEPMAGFCHRLQMWRHRLGLTQAEAAHLLDTPERTYWEYEKGKTEPLLPYQEGAIARFQRALESRH